MGEDEKFATITRVRPRFFTSPSSGNLINYYRNNLGDSLTTGVTTSLSNGKYDLKRSARWHRLEFSFTGPVELGAMDVSVVEDGSA